VPKGLFHAIPNAQKQDSFDTFVTFHKHEEVNKILYLLALSNEEMIFPGQQISCQNPIIFFFKKSDRQTVWIIFLMLEMYSTPSWTPGAP